MVLERRHLVFLEDVRLSVRWEDPADEEVVLRGRGEAETSEGPAEAEQQRNRLSAEMN